MDLHYIKAAFEKFRNEALKDILNSEELFHEELYFLSLYNQIPEVTN